MNISKKDIQWSLKLACDNKLLQEGVFKFLQKDGTPYPTTGSQGTCGKLEPNQTEAVCIMFSPGEWLWSFSFFRISDDSFCYSVCCVVICTSFGYKLFYVFVILVLSGEINLQLLNSFWESLLMKNHFAVWLSLLFRSISLFWDISACDTWWWFWSTLLSFRPCGRS